MTLDLRVRVEQLPGAKLVRDYYDAAPALAPFFPGHPSDPAAWTRTAAAVRQHFDAETLQRMPAAIRAGTDAARAKLDRIAHGEGFFVQTGQQAGLFGGPLYTVHKITTAIRLARALEQQLGVPVAPLFWIAADDHDFAEVARTYVLSQTNELVALELADDGGPPASMKRRALGPSVQQLHEALRELLPQTDFASELAALVERAYRPDNSVADAFGELIAFLFDRFDLLITSSADPVLKQLSVPLMQHELRHAEAHEDIVNAQTQQLVSRGYHEQVPVRSDAANVSYEDENGRDRLMRLGTDWELSRSKVTFSRADIDGLLASEPTRFSANVLLRPIIASAVFPTLAYVGGPAEISYFAQIGCLFAAHNIPMPIVVPRAAIEIVERKVQKVLDKFKLEPSDVRVRFDDLATRLVRAELPKEITDTLALMREQLAHGYGQLVELTEPIDPTIRRPLEAARNHGFKMLTNMEKKIVRQLKKRSDIGLDQLKRVSTNLFPFGQPQERVLGVVTYYARYGPAVLDAIADAVDFEFDRPAPAWSGVTCG